MSTVDDLMNILPLEATPDDIDKIIAHYRANRARIESGVKPKKETGPEVKIDLIKLGLAKPEGAFKRRF